MLSFQAATDPRALSHKHKVGLAVAGGGPIGGIYELGALRAIEELIDGVTLTRLDAYVGVSSGAIMAAALANRIDTAEMSRILLSAENAEHPFHPEIFLKPAFVEYAKRVARVPQVLGEVALAMLKNPFATKLSESLGKFGALLPTGLFDNSEVELFLRKLFTSGGRSNDFRDLDRPLTVVAVELDSGQTVRFGAPGYADVPISKAIQASSALPGLYPPVEIKRRHFVDGALKRTLNASVVLEAGMDLVIGLNPLVPYNADRALAMGKRKLPSLVKHGLPAVLSQTFRSLLQSRMQVGLAKYESMYEHADILLVEPDPDDGEMFFTNEFSFASRQHLAAHAYARTLSDFRRSKTQVNEMLGRHGLRLNEKVLGDNTRTIWTGLKQKPMRRTPATARLARALEDLDAQLTQRTETRSDDMPNPI
jgi:NTE family protein